MTVPGRDELRRPLLIAALVAVFAAALVSFGTALISRPPPFVDRGAQLTGAGLDPSVRSGLQARGVDPTEAVRQLKSIGTDTNPPGLAIPYLALVTLLLLLVLVLVALPLLIGHRATGTVQGVVSIVGGLVAVIAGILMALFALAALLLMVGLFLAAPFGTLAYLALFGFFDRSGAAIALGLITVLLVAAGVLLVLAHQRFLQNKGLVLLLLTCLLLDLVTGFLQGIVPGILVSITDAIAALVVAIVGIVWGLVVLIGGIVGAVRLLQLTRQGGATQLVRPG